MEKQKTQALSASDDRRPRPPGESLAAGELDHPPTPNPRASTAIAISEVFPYLARRHLPGSAPPPPPRVPWLGGGGGGLGESELGVGGRRSRGRG